MPDTLHRLLFLEPGAGIWHGRGNSKWGPDKGAGQQAIFPVESHFARRQALFGKEYAQGNAHRSS